MSNYNITKNSIDELANYYDKKLNIDKSLYKNSNDECTPITLINEMYSKLPLELFERENLLILDPCCGNGNFEIPLLEKLQSHHTNKQILEDIIFFNDINLDRLNNIKKIFCDDKYKLKISNYDFLKEYPEDKLFDLIVANPPYAKILEDGKRASKNHNLIGDFIKKSLKLLKPEGYLLFLTPDNWMSYSDRNVLIRQITELQIIHLDIHTAKKYFKKIGSSFTWYIIQNKKAYKDISISGIWNKELYNSHVKSQIRSYIPLYYNGIIQNILKKTIDNNELAKYPIKTNSYLHKYTKKDLICDIQSEKFKYKLIHTPTKTVYSSKPHKYQDNYKVFISLTNKYSLFIDDCGMTQSIAFIICSSKKEAEEIKKILEHPLYTFINNICRYGNFNNVRILQQFPIPKNNNNIYKSFDLTNEEIDFIKKN